MKLLFVCLGNICRSPTAHGVMAKKVMDAGLKEVVVDSAGTAAYHIGKAPDSRTQQAAVRAGYDLSDLRARQVEVQDFYHFDYIFAMDLSNLENLKSLKPSDSKAIVQLALAHSSVDTQSVPDPYYGGEDGFDEVLTLCELLSDDILSSVIKAKL